MMVTGPATIKLRDGRVYVAERAELWRHRLTFTGQLRVSDTTGERLYPPRDLSILRRRVRSIEWLEGDE